MSDSAPEIDVANYILQSESLIDFWQNKLLDSTKRNILLNFRPTKRRHVKIGNILFENLQNYHESSQKQIFLIWDTGSEFIHSYFKHKADTQLELLDYSSVLHSLANSSKKHYQETSINVLFIAYGLVKYKENVKDERIYEAPLLLIPVELKKIKKKKMAKSIKETPKTPSSFFYINFLDEEIIHNPFLDHHLNKTINFDIPNYSDSNSLEEYIFNIESIVKKRKDIEIIYDCYLGFYSFHKYIMYNDLLVHKDLLRNKPFFRKITGYNDDDIKTVFTNPSILDEIENPKESFSVFESDSSQRLAILSAKKGRNFYLEGPPGTGKSQTIANIIAEFIGLGKSVLFVCEKKVALDVVYERLKEAGLADYLLDLHNPKKMKKKNFYSELGVSLIEKLLQEEETIDLKFSNKEFYDLRLQLNTLAKLMNTRYSDLEITPVQIFVKLIELDNIPDVKFRVKRIFIQQELIETNLIIINNFIEYSDFIPSYLSFLWKDFKYSVSPEDQHSLTIKLNKLKEINELVNDLLPIIKEIIPEDFDILENSLNSVKEFLNIFNIIYTLKFSDSNQLIKEGISNLNLDDLKSFYEELKEFLGVIDRYINQENQISKTFSQEIYDAPLKDYISILRLDFDTKLKRIIKFYSYYKLKKKIKKYFLNHSKRLSKYEIIKNNLLLVASTIQLKQKIDEFISNNKAITHLYLDQSIDELNKSKSYLDLFLKIVNHLQLFFICIERIHPKKNEEITEISRNKLYDKIFNYITQNSDDIIKVIYEKYNSFTEEIISLEAFFNAQFEKNLYIHEKKLSEILLLIEKLTETSIDYNSFFNLNKLYLEASKYDLKDFLDNFFNEKIEISSITNSFNKQLYLTILEDLKDKFPDLELINPERIGLVDYFIDKDKMFLKNGNERIENSRINATAISKYKKQIHLGGEVAFILHEADKTRVHKPLRQALTFAPKIIKALKPVFFMSPLSTSYYIDPLLIQFDLVIFDEASQIVPEEALNAIIRGKQVIIVGDTKQMPPTRFFDSFQSLNISDNEEGKLDQDLEEMINQEGEEGEKLVLEDSTVILEKTTGINEEEKETLIEVDEINVDESNYLSFISPELINSESILEFCNITALDQLRLKYHYRSQHEQLIAFSNSNFYDSELITFPNPFKNSSFLGLELKIIPNGIYDRGKSRTNIIEARNIAEITSSMMKEDSNLSFGIVAFSEAQQEAIEQIFNEDEFLSESLDNEENNEQEPLFIKNLESVQGDERDIIIISIGYGKDKNGKFYSNFGPVTKRGGERRFNVLITRARQKMIVITSVHPDEYPVNSQNKQIDIIRRFLYFALTHDRKYLSYGETEKSFNIPYESVNKKLIDTITEGGYTHQRNFGFSNAPLELVVKHPQKEDFIAVIESDGYLYYKLATARDRDRLRSQILENLGWFYIRVWVNNWYFNEENAINNIKEKLKHAEDIYDQKKKTLDQKSKIKKNKSDKTPIKDKKKSDISLKDQFEQIINNNTDITTEYEYTDISNPPLNLSLSTPYLARDMRNKSRKILLKEQINKIINQESPIHKSFLYKRILTIWDQRRLVNTVKNLIDETLIELNRSYYFEFPFYWKSMKQITNWRKLKIRKLDEKINSLDLLSKEEIANLIAFLFESFESSTESEIKSIILKLYNIKRATKKENQRINDAFDFLIRMNLIRSVNNLWRWNTENIENLADISDKNVITKLIQYKDITIRIFEDKVKHSCSICKKQLIKYDEVAFCKFCQNGGHKSHIMEWVKIKAKCPYCHKDLKL